MSAIMKNMIYTILLRAKQIIKKISQLRNLYWDEKSIRKMG
jgi:hypothetical protein